uniref:Uncharacterized protein n=1 Tax=Rhizophora mucronata TaxID=61149 RepID=A0A2P2NT38_RHIMU
MGIWSRETRTERLGLYKSPKPMSCSTSSLRRLQNIRGIQVTLDIDSLAMD